MSKNYPKGKLEKPKKIARANCWRCGGNGNYATFGVCFRCGGTGDDPTNRNWAFPATWSDSECAEWDEKRLARNEKARERAEKKRAEKHAAGVEKVKALLPLTEEVTDLYYSDEVEDRDYWMFRSITFVGDVRSKAIRYDGDISAKAIAAAEKASGEMLAKWADHKSGAGDDVTPAPEGRIEVSGEVLSVKVYDGDWGRTVKMLIRLPGGAKAFGTVPAAISWVEKGDTVKFTATFERSEDDPGFAKFKRPSKATATEREPEGDGVTTN